MQLEKIDFAAKTEERLRLLEVPTEMLRELTITLCELVRQLVKPRKEQTG